MPQWAWSIIASIIGATIGGGGIYAYLKLGVEKRRIEAAAQLDSSTVADRLWTRIDQLQQDLDHERRQRRALEDRVEALERERDEWRRGAEILTEQIEENGDTPRWRWQECQSAAT